MHNRILFILKEELNYAVCRQVNGTGDHHDKQSNQPPMDKGCMFSLVCGN
jgi:hypothetical protein